MEILKTFPRVFCFPKSRINENGGNASLASGMLPHNLKLADITPLHKKGAKIDRKKYRPVSLTLVVCKVCEIIYSKTATCSVLDYKRVIFSGAIWLPEREILSFSIIIYVSRLGQREKQRLGN